MLNDDADDERIEHDEHLEVENLDEIMFEMMDDEEVELVVTEMVEIDDYDIVDMVEVEVEVQVEVEHDVVVVEVEIEQQLGDIDAMLLIVDEEVEDLMLITDEHEVGDEIDDLD